MVAATDTVIEWILNGDDPIIDGMELGEGVRRGTGTSAATGA